QKAAAYALDADMEPTLLMKQAFENRRDLVLELLSDVPGMKLNHPQGAFYFFPDISGFFGTTDGEYQINDSLDFCEYLLQKAHVATVAGVAFDAPECFRFSY